jgi:hypothetical protein
MSGGAPAGWLDELRRSAAKSTSAKREHRELG